MPAQILHLLRIGQDHFQLAIVQNVENWFPIRSRALHHHMRTFVLMQPHPQLLQSLSEHAELAYFQRRCGLGISTHYANHYKLSPYVNTGTTFDHGWNHLFSPFFLLSLPCMDERSTGSSCSTSLRSIQGATTLRRVRFIIGRIQVPTITRNDPFHHGVFTL